MRDELRLDGTYIWDLIGRRLKDGKDYATRNVTEEEAHAALKRAFPEFDGRFHNKGYVAVEEQDGLTAVIYSHDDMWREFLFPTALYRRCIASPSWQFTDLLLSN